MSGKTTYSIEAVFKAIDKITGPMKKMTDQTNMFSKRMGAGVKIAGQFSGGLASGIERTGKRAFVGATVGAVALGAAIKDIVTVGMEFDRSLVKAAIKFPNRIRKGTEAYKELEDAARNVGRTTEFTSSQAAEGLNFLAMAGFDAKQSIASLPGVVNLATAADIDLARATDITTDALGAAGLMTKDTIQLQKNLTRMNDVIVGSTNSANFTIEQFYEAMANGLPTVTAAGQSVETFSSLLGLMANAGIKGGEAGTAVRNMFLRLQAPVGAARGVIKKYAGDVVDARTGALIPFEQVIGRLEKSMGGLGKAKQAGILNEIFGLRAIGGAQNLFREGETTIANFRTTLEGIAGASTTVADAIRSDTKASVDSLGSAVESLKLSLYGLESGPVQGLIDGMTKWVRTNEGLIAQKIGDTVKWIKANFWDLVDTIKNVVLAFASLWVAAKIMTVVSAVTTLITVLKALSATALISMGWAGLIIAALAAAAFLIIKYWEPIKEFFKGLWDGIVAVWRAAVDWISAKVDDMVHNGAISWILFGIGLVSKAMDYFGVTWSGIWDAIVSAASAAFDFFLSATGLRGFIDMISLLPDLWTSVSEAATLVWDAIVSGITSAYDWVMKLISPITDLWKKFMSFKGQVIDEEILGRKPKVTTEDKPSGFATPKLLSREDRALIEQHEIDVAFGRGGADITLRDDTGRARVDRVKPGTTMTLIRTGAL